MLIESLIRRKNGTKVEFGSTVYHFQPDNDGRHVADVDNQAHVSALIAIKDGFRLADAADAADGSPFDTITGPFFVVRGPQDVEAFRQWALAIPDMLIDEEAIADIEAVLLIDKISIGEASLGGYPFPDLTVSPDLFSPVGAGAPLEPESTPSAPGDNTILPQNHGSRGDDAALRAGDTSIEGNGGADTGGGVRADSPATDEDEGDGEEVDEADEDEQPQPVVATTPPQPLDREKLAKEYDELFGHRPNGKWTAEKIAAALAEKKANG